MRTTTAASRRALPVLMAGTFMIVLDFFIVNVALPSMQAKLHAGNTTLEWVVAGYGLTFSTFLITSGRLGDRIGRRRLLTIGLATFAAASAGCGLGPDAGALIAFRLLQGVGGALISPTVLSIIGVTYQRADRVRAMSIYGTGALTMRFGRSVIGAGALILAAGHGLLIAAVAEGTGGSVGWLAPGLVLVGLGMGLCIAPLSTVVLSACDPARAGAAVGALSTVQRVGNSIGVAVIGIVFFGGLHHGYGHAFDLSLGVLALLLVVVAGVSRLLPGPAAGSGPARSRRAPEESLARLRQLAGTPVARAEQAAGGTVAVTLSDWQIAVADVAPSAWADLARLAGVAGGCRLAGAGRYGRFWWLSFMAGSDRAVVLGSDLRIAPVGGGDTVGVETPDLESGYSLV